MCCFIIMYTKLSFKKLILFFRYINKFNNYYMWDLLLLNICDTTTMVEWHLLETTFARMAFVQSIGNLSWLNLTFGQGSPSLLPFPSLSYCFSPSPSLVPFPLTSLFTLRKCHSRKCRFAQMSLNYVYNEFTCNINNCNVKYIFLIIVISNIIDK